MFGYRPNLLERVTYSDCKDNQNPLNEHYRKPTIYNECKENINTCLANHRY